MDKLNKKKILFLTHHWKENSHHSKYSGYQALVYYARNNHDCTVVTWGLRNKVLNEDGINVHYVKPFFKRDFFFSKRLAISSYARKIENRFDIVHALYSDCGFFQSHPNFYSTIHVSPFVAKNVKLIYLLFLFLKYLIIERRVIDNSKRVVVVSENLKRVGSNKNISKFVFIPHGVNTTYWSPENGDNAGKRSPFPENFVLCVGNHGIDKQTLSETIKRHPDINFIAVGLKNFNLEYNNLKVLHNISDNELKKMYKYCDLFVRPMDFATANNSILEALSMGCRVIISTPDASCDYTSVELGNKDFKVVNSSDFPEVFRSFLNSGSRHTAKDSIRKYAVENFDWSVIWRQTASIFESRQR